MSGVIVAKLIYSVHNQLLRIIALIVLGCPALYDGSIVHQNRNYPRRDDGSFLIAPHLPNHTDLTRPSHHQLIHQQQQQQQLQQQHQHPSDNNNDANSRVDSINRNLKQTFTVRSEMRAASSAATSLGVETAAAAAAAAKRKATELTDDAIRNQNNNFININDDLALTDQNNDLLVEIYKTPMYFGTANATIVTSQIGATAHIPCIVHNIGEGVVSWIRRKDYHLLTVGLTSYSSDLRYTATHLQNSEDWTLQIKYVQLHDAGVYECQVSTHPPTSIFLHLNVVEARAEIVGPSVRYLTPGSLLKIFCRIIQGTEMSVYIFWYQDSRMINYDTDSGISVTTDTEYQHSELTIARTAMRHSGNYTCMPSNANAASVLVQIFKGDNPAAMYHEHLSSGKQLKPFSLALYVCCCCGCWFSLMFASAATKLWSMAQFKIALPTESKHTE